MRFINRERVQAKLSDDWLKDATTALDSIKDFPAKERKEVIRKNLIFGAV